MQKTFIKGNEAIAEAAIRAGCRFFAGYPITPQNEIPEYMSRRQPEVHGVFVQGESEIASIYMVYGAACSGTRAMTSSSGPGISLKAEGLSYLSGAALPAVIVDVSRTGPGLGNIDPGQYEYSFFKSPGHGGFRVMVLAPSSVQEAVDLTYQAFDLADRDRNPVVILVDGVIGAVMESVILPEAKADFPDKSDWIIDGCQGRPFRVNNSSNLNNLEWEAFHQSRADMYESWQQRDVKVEEYLTQDADFILVAYGTSARLCKAVVNQLRQEKYRVGLIRPITLVPFPSSSIDRLDYRNINGVLVVEMCLPSQMLPDVELAVARRVPVHTFGRGGGIIFSVAEIADVVRRYCSRGE